MEVRRGDAVIAYAALAPWRVPEPTLRAGVTAMTSVAIALLQK
jgi:hypothetical protein